MKTLLTIYRVVAVLILTFITIGVSTPDKNSGYRSSSSGGSSGSSWGGSSSYGSGSYSGGGHK